MEAYQRIVFIDFDGTITSEDTLEEAMKLFVPAAEYERQYQELKAGRLTLSQALHIAFDQAPASILPQLVAYVKQVPLRAGFAAFLEAMGNLGIPVVVISGGLKPLVEASLAPFRKQFLAVYSVSLDLSGGFLKLVSPWDDGVELVKKTAIMATYHYEQAICVGDSYTDIKMAKASQMVFARDRLAAILKKEGAPFFSWNNFHDVTQEIISSK